MCRQLLLLLRWQQKPYGISVTFLQPPAHFHAFVVFFPPNLSKFSVLTLLSFAQESSKSFTVLTSTLLQSQFWRLYLSCHGELPGTILKPGLGNMENHATYLSKWKSRSRRSLLQNHMHLCQDAKVKAEVGGPILRCLLGSLIHHPNIYIYIRITLIDQKMIHHEFWKYSTSYCFSISLFVYICFHVPWAKVTCPWTWMMRTSSSRCQGSRQPCNRQVTAIISSIYFL